MDAPTSEITPPKPAMTAANNGNLASLHKSHNSCGFDAPIPSNCSASFGSSAWKLAIVKPATMGNAMITWAIFAMLITATPIFAWRYMLRQEKKKPAATVPAQTGPQDAVAAGTTAAPYQPQPMPAHATPPHTPHGQQKPSWAASTGKPIRRLRMR